MSIVFVYRHGDFKLHIPLKSSRFEGAEPACSQDKNIIRPATAYGRDLTAATQRNPRAPKIDKHKILLTTARYGTRRFFTSTTGPMFDEAGAVSSSRSSATMTGGGIEGSGPRRW